MSLETDYQAIVKRLRGWGFQIREESGCYGRNNGTVYRNGRPDGHVNHHYVCSLNPSQSYIDGLVSNLVAGKTINWFADVNGHGYLCQTGPANHAGTGNSSVRNRTLNGQPPPGPATSPGDMSGNQNYSGTEGQHPGDSTPWPQPLLEIMFAINAAQFIQWNLPAACAIMHYEWTNRKIDMSWEGGPSSTKAGNDLRSNVQRYMSGSGGGGGTGDWFDMATKEDLTAAIKEQLDYYLPRALNVLMNGQPNAAFPKDSTLALDGKGITKATVAAQKNEPYGDSAFYNNIVKTGQLAQQIRTVQNDTEVPLLNTINTNTKK